MVRVPCVAFILLIRLAAAEPDLARLDAIVEKSRSAWRVPGVAVAIVKDDRVVLLKGYGVKADGKPDPVTTDTVFAIGSTTKAFTTAAMAMLVDEGKMAWDDPVRKHVPTFRLSDPLADAMVTLRDLASHRTGLARHDQLWSGSPWGRAEIMRRIGFVPLDQPFRSRWQYQNIMFLVAGQAVGNTSGIGWNDFVQKRIFEPLGMSSANLTTAGIENAADVATPHARAGDGVRAIRWRNIDNIGPAGSINASARDMAKWVRLQLGRGALEGKRLISEKQFDEMHTPQMAMRPEDAGRNWNPEAEQPAYGLGWFIGSYRGHRLVNHGGAIDGFRASVTLVPRERLGIVVLSNLNQENMPEALRWRLVDALLGLPERDWDAELIQHFKPDPPQELRRVSGTQPSLPLNAYEGVYDNAGYGEVKISSNGSGLVIAWRNQPIGKLEHLHYDTFSLGRTAVPFRLSAEGAPTEVVLFSQTFRRK